MAVDAAIDDQPGGDDDGVSPGPGQALGEEGNFQAAGNLEEVDAAPRNTVFPDLADKGVTRLIDDFLVPASLNKSDSFNVHKRAHPELEVTTGAAARTTAPDHDGDTGVPFSSIRTMTVGFGMTPNLLTPPMTSAGARGLMRALAQSPPVGISTPPRER